jgi:hypothetical protein
MKKLRSYNIVSIGIIILGMTLLAGWYFLPKLMPEPKNKSEYDNLSNALKNYGNELAALEEIHNFPIYPGATFIRKEDTLPCPTPLISGYTDCGSVAYRWGVNEDTEKVQYWYTGDSIKKMGWDFKGGAGAMGSITKSSLENQKDNFKVDLIIVSNNTLDENAPKAIYKTTFSVLLPK